MILQKLAELVKEQRRALGLSQAQLAALADLSRVTIVDLEAGKVSELGVAKLEKLLAIFGWTLEPRRPAHDKKPSGLDNDPLSIAARSASTSYRQILTAPMLEESLVSGALPAPYRAHLASLINEAPAPLLIRAVSTAAEKRHINPKVIWKNISRWSHELQTTRTL